MKLLICVFSILLFLQSCSNDKIETTSTRELVPEPDKEMRIQWETNQSLLDISNQVSNSDSIVLCKAGQKILNSGKEIIPYLQSNFLDSTVTNVYSEENQRNLSIGEVAILLTSTIQQIPIFQVVGVQQCTPPFETDIEHFLDYIKKNPNRFLENFDIWMDSTIIQ